MNNDNKKRANKYLDIIGEVDDSIVSETSELTAKPVRTDRNIVRFMSLIAACVAVGMVLMFAKLGGFLSDREPNNPLATDATVKSTKPAETTPMPEGYWQKANNIEQAVFDDIMVYVRNGTMPCFTDPSEIDPVWTINQFGKLLAFTDSQSSTHFSAEKINHMAQLHINPDINLMAADFNSLTAENINTSDPKYRGMDFSTVYDAESGDFKVSLEHEDEYSHAFYPKRIYYHNGFYYLACIETYVKYRIEQEGEGSSAVLEAIYSGDTLVATGEVVNGEVEVTYLIDNDDYLQWTLFKMSENGKSDSDGSRKFIFHSKTLIEDNAAYLAETEDYLDGSGGTTENYDSIKDSFMSYLQEFGDMPYFENPSELDAGWVVNKIGRFLSIAMPNPIGEAGAVYTVCLSRGQINEALKSYINPDADIMNADFSKIDYGKYLGLHHDVDYIPEMDSFGCIMRGDAMYQYKYEIKGYYLGEDGLTHIACIEKLYVGAGDREIYVNGKLVGTAAYVDVDGQYQMKETYTVDENDFEWTLFRVHPQYTLEHPYDGCDLSVYKMYSKTLITDKSAFMAACNSAE